MRDYHCSVSLGILWRENQNTMIVESQIDFPATTQKPNIINHEHNGISINWSITLSCLLHLTTSLILSYKLSSS